MRYFTAALAVVTTSLWLGGLVALAVLVTAIFVGSGLDRQTAGRAAGVIFIWFGRGQLIIGALALIAIFLGYLQHRSGLAMFTFALLGLGAVGAVIFSAYFIPKIEALRIAGQSETPEFQSLHKQSQNLVTGLTGVVFVAALLLPAFCRALLSPKPKSDSLSA